MHTVFFEGLTHHERVHRDKTESTFDIQRILNWQGAWYKLAKGMAGKF